MSTLFVPLIVFATYHRVASLLVAAVLLSFITPKASGSLRFGEDQPELYQFGDQRVLPPTFGAGEFTFELWVKLDVSFPVGRTDRGSIGQLRNWSDADPRPYSDPTWWFAGNFLLDGHTRPDGWSSMNTREGTFSLQVYGGGRLRWMFADDGDIAPVGKVWAVEVYPASSTPSLLDARWHQVTCVRRWAMNSKAALELWIDGRLIGSQRIPLQTNTRQFWDHLPHPRNPKQLGGWCWGSEVMTAWKFFFTQYENFKGLIAHISFWDRAKDAEEIATSWQREPNSGDKSLVGYFPLNEEMGTTARDRIDPLRVIELHHPGVEAWSPDDPFKR